MTRSPEQWINFYLLAMIRAGSICFAASGVVATLMHFQPVYYVPGELASVIFWTVPFAIGVSFFSFIALLLFSLLPRFVTYPLAIGLGVISGFLWATVLYTLFLNPYFGTFLIPVAWVWT